MQGGTRGKGGCYVGIGRTWRDEEGIEGVEGGAEEFLLLCCMQ
jgi:hypothetical protein